MLFHLNCRFVKARMHESALEGDYVQILDNMARHCRAMLLVGFCATWCSQHLAIFSVHYHSLDIRSQLLTPGAQHLCTECVKGTKHFDTQTRTSDSAKRILSTRQRQEYQ